jgi:hypothetical protein
MSVKGFFYGLHFYEAQIIHKVFARKKKYQPLSSGITLIFRSK